MAAIKHGAKTQHEIKVLTRISADEISDAIADLYADGKLNRQALKRRQYIAA